MKKLITKGLAMGLLAIALSPLVVQAQTSSLWKVLNNILQPVLNTWTLELPYLGGGGTQCVQTDNNGLLTASGSACGGSGSQTPWTSNINGGGHNLTDAGSITGTNFTATSSTASIFPVLRDGEVANIHKDGSVTYTVATTSSDLGRGTALLTALSNAQTGDTIQLASTTYNIASTTLDESIKDVSIIGAGKYSTQIVSTVPGTEVIRAGNYTTTADLSILATSTFALSLPYGNKVAKVTNAILRNVYISGESDGIYFQNGDNNGQTILTASDVTVDSAWDCTFFANLGNVYIYDSVFTSVAVPAVSSGLFTDGIDNHNGGNVYVYNSRVSVSGGSSNNNAVFNTGTLTQISGGSYTSSGTSAFDLNRNAGTVQVTANTIYTTTTGTISFIDNTPIRKSIGSSGASSTLLVNENGIAGWQTVGSLGLSNYFSNSGGSDTTLTTGTNLQAGTLQSTDTGGQNNFASDVNITGNLQVTPGGAEGTGFLTTGTGGLENSQSFGIGNWMEAPNSADDVFTDVVPKASVFALSTQDSSDTTGVNPWGAVISLIPNTAHDTLITSIIGTQFGLSGQPIALGVDVGGDELYHNYGAMVGTADFNSGIDALFQMVGGASLQGKLYDNSGSAGTSGQVLTSTGSNIAWAPVGGSSFAWPFTLATNYGSTNQATTGIAWFQNGLNASSTSHFVNASTTALSVSGLISGNCVQAGFGGLLTTSGSACGSGGGTGPATSTNPLMFSYSVATSTATSTFAGQVTIATSTASLLPLQTIFSYGDSLTLSVGASSNQNAWPSVLQTMSGYGTWREGVSGAFSVDIKNRLLAEPASQLAQPTTILAGYNDATNGVSSTTIEANIAAMVAGLKTTHYLILGIPTGSNTPSTTPAYTVIVSVNSFLANTYGNHFLDIRQYLLTKGNGSAQDNADIFGGLVPSSLRQDFIHPNDLGNYYIAQDINQNALSVLVAPPTAIAVNQYQLLNTLANPPTIGVQKQAPAYFSYLSLNSNQVSASSTSFGSQIDDSEVTMPDLTLGGVPNDGNHPYPTDNMSSPMMVFRDSTGADAADLRIGSETNGNICLGHSSCLSMTSAGATQNFALGGFALSSAVNVQNMIAIGVGTLQSGTGGNNTVAIGDGACNNSAAGVNNTCVGTNAGAGHGTGNVFLGQFAGGMITNGNYNIFIGNNTGTFGRQITTGTDNIIIGEQAFNQGSSTNLINATGIGSYVELANDNTFILGPTAYNQAIANYEPNIGIGTTTPNATTQIVKPSGLLQDFFKISSSTSISNVQDIFRINSAGNVAITNTSASALSVADGFGTNVLTVNTSSSTGPILTVQATSSLTTLFSVDQYGHLLASSTPAGTTVGACGTGTGVLSAGSNDVTGDVTTATAATSCIITFGVPYSVTPEVLITGGSAASITAVTSRSTTGFTIGLGTAATGDDISYFVIQP